MSVNACTILHATQATLVGFNQSDQDELMPHYKFVPSLCISFTIHETSDFIVAKDALRGLGARWEPADRKWWLPANVTSESAVSQWALQYFSNIFWDTEPSKKTEFCCPCCGASSANVHDIQHSYCQFCNWFAADGYDCPKHSDTESELIIAQSEIKRRRFRLDEN